MIGLAIQIVVTALCFLGVRLWNCFIKQLTPQTAVEESACDQTLLDGDAVPHANAMPDLEMGNGYGRVEGGESLTGPDLELGIVNSGEGIEHISDQEAHTPEIKSPVITRRPRSRETQQQEPLCAMLKWTPSSFPARRSLSRNVSGVANVASPSISLLSILRRMVKFYHWTQF